MENVLLSGSDVYDCDDLICSDFWCRKEIDEVTKLFIFDVEINFQVVFPWKDDKFVLCFLTFRIETQIVKDELLCCNKVDKVQNTYF